MHTLLAIVQIAMDTVPELLRYAKQGKIIKRKSLFIR